MTRISIREESKDWILTLCAGTNLDRPKFEVLIASHFAEIAVDKDVCHLDVAWDLYSKTAQLDLLTLITVRDGDELVGYFLSCILPNLHFRKVKQATEDSHYLLPQYRRLGYGETMVEAMEKAVLAKGAILSKVRTKCHSYNGDFWQKMGYTHIEDVYQKVLLKRN